MAFPGTTITMAMVEPRAAQMREAVAASYGKTPDRAAAAAQGAGITLAASYRSRLTDGASDAVRVQERLSAQLGLIGVKAAREQLTQLIRKRTVGSETARKLVRELDLAEARYRG